MTPVEQLEHRLGASWPAIKKARADTHARRVQLDSIFRSRNSPDTSLVVFGSVARREVTISSDLDWILLIDGQSVPEHKDQERDVSTLLTDNELIKPGKSGVFGRMVSSHDLVHNIGGEDDLNSNTTRRVLLLLESYPVGNREAYDRVRRQILRRYLEDDRGLLYGSGAVRLPRFLLNDFTRYWRTVTVDFVYKQRDGNGGKWPIRNAKLRMSRKLVFASGLLRCFFCHLDPDADEAREHLKGPDKDLSPLIEYMERQLALTPLDLLAKACLVPTVSDETADSIFANYDQFLSILDDTAKRLELEQAKNHAELRASTAWSEVRQISRAFHDGLVSVFLTGEGELQDLTRKYGVF